MAINSIYTGPRLGLRGGGASAARKEARKRKFDQVTEPDASTGGKRFISEPESADELDTAASPSAKSHEGTEHETDSSVSSGQEDKGEEARGKATEDKSNATKPKPQRFVVFVGNLPYTATDALIRRHFASLKPTSIRHRCEKGSGKSKGFAFLEFRSYDHMKTCLEKFHQSVFDDGSSPARKLNVELTAGGGGSKSKDRRTKLKAKNEKLRQERERRALNVIKPKEQSTEAQKATHKRDDHQDVHPSRRPRVR